jgi:protein transport protein SEC31
VPPSTPKADGADIFDAPGYSRTAQSTLSLKQPPKWLRRPVSNSFGFGGKFVTVSNLSSAQGKHQSAVVHTRKIVTESDLVDRATRLQTAIEGQTLSAFAEVEASGGNAEGAESWKALLSLFKADSRDELITLLGYSSAEVAARVAEAIAKLKEPAESTSNLKSSEEESIPDTKPHEQVVSFLEPEVSEGSDGERDDGVYAEKTPSEVSAGVSETTSAARLADGESTTTAPSLFGDDIGTPQIDAAADFFSTMGMSSQDDGGQQVIVPHHNYGLDSSVAATVGSGPSSVASDNLRINNFRIYPTEESDTDRLVTKALVLGDFESAVSLCLSSDRFADAILLAVKGGPELLARTQKAYFQSRSTSSPYLRLFQSIVTDDLSDIVQNADLRDWQEIFVVLCTFASSEEFSSLTEQLGQRLEFQFSLATTSEALDAPARAHKFRKNATLTYLAAGRLERLLNIWIDELAEEEKLLISDETELNCSRYTAHAHALQSFIEKVTVFRSAIKYIDADLSQTTTSEEADVKTYRLAGLYDRYFEYADLLATQGLVKEALAFLKLTPADYKGSVGTAFDFGIGRERLLAAAGSTVARVAASIPATKSALPALPTTTGGHPYSQYATQGQPRTTTAQAPAPSQPSIYQPFNAPAQSQPNSTYAPPHPLSQPQYQPAAPMYNPAGNYSAPHSLTQPPHLANQSAPSNVTSMLPPPPPRGPSAAGMSGTLPTAPPPKRRENGGWNDAPAMTGDRRGGPAALNANKPAAIVSPFPNATPSSVPSTPGSPYAAQNVTPLPPPPRPRSVQTRQPPPQVQRIPPPPQAGSGMYPPPGRPPSGPSGPPQSMVPPSRHMSPPQHQGPPRQATPGQYGPPVGQTPPPGPYAQTTPPPGPPRALPGAPSPYVRATPPPMPPQQQQGLYGGPANPPAGPYGPPPGASRPVIPAQSQGPPRGPQTATPSAPPTRIQRGPPPPKYRQSNLILN